MRGKGERAEQVGKCGVAHIQSAGEGTESRHHHARLVGRKATPADGTPAMRNTRDRMQMAADLADGAGRQMAKGQSIERQRFGECSTNARGWLGVMIAGDPDPVAPALKTEQVVTIVGGKPRRAAAIVEAVAERQHATRRVLRDQSAET